MKNLTKIILMLFAITLFASPTWGGQHDNMISIYGKDANEVMTKGKILRQADGVGGRHVFTIKHKERIYYCIIGPHYYECRTPNF